MDETESKKRMRVKDDGQRNERGVSDGWTAGERVRDGRRQLLFDLYQVQIIFYNILANMSVRYNKMHNCMVRVPM